MDTAKMIASELLQINAIKLSPTNPFTWASGWKSPVYCDNRRTLSFPKVRRLIRDGFVELIRTDYPDAEIIAGVATGAIAHGVLVADSMNLPFIYIRSSMKGHGLENLIEGDYSVGKQVVIIEDLISTGGSSLKAFTELKAAGLDVLGMAAIFSYGFPVADENFRRAGCPLKTLSNYESLLSRAVQTGYVAEHDLELLNEWRQSPDRWGV